MASKVKQPDDDSSPRELRGKGSLHRINGAFCAEVTCYVLEETDRAGEAVWRGFCQVMRSDGLLPGRQRLVLRLEGGLSAVLEEARVSLEADSHSLRVTFKDARPLASAAPLPPGPRIGIIGPGAMGCLFGGLLALAGHDVWMVCRRLELAELLEREGIILEEDGETRRALVRATADARQAAPLDLAIVLVKSYDTPAAACSLQSALAPGSHVLSLQNGLRNVETLAEKLGEERILGGVTSQGATLLGPGHVRHAGSGPTVIAESHARADSSRARQTARLLARAGIATTVSDDLRSLLWGKLVVSTAANGLTALSGLRNGELLESPLSLIMDDLARETAAVAAAVGVSLPYADPVKHTRSVMLATAPNRSSMLQDIEAGRPTEVGALNQAVGVEGARLGVPTPLNHALSILIREFEGRAK